MLSNWFKWLIRRLLIKNTTQNEILEIEIREHQEQGQDPYSQTNFKKVEDDHDDQGQEKDR